MEALDAIVVGGGHNGLVAGAYLARAGMRTVILEARGNTGGAATTETPWGPDFKVTALSYVMSLMPPTIISDLQLERHGYDVIPMGPSYVAFPDGRSMLLHEEPDRDHKEIAKFSRHDADRLGDYDAWLHGVADVLAPLLLQAAPSLGSHRPADLLEQLRLAWGVRGLDVRSTGDATRLFTSSIRDLLDRWFESSEVKGVMAINGIIGTLGGPGRARHRVRDDAPHDRRRRRRKARARGASRSAGMGAVSDAIRRSAESFGADVRTNAPVARILVRDGRVIGVTLVDGTELRATARRRRNASADHVPPPDRPRRAARRLRRRHRALALAFGMVKVNVALSELPDFIADPGNEPNEHYTGSVELCHSIDYLSRAFHDAREGRPAAQPFSDGVIPSTVDPSLCPEGTHVMSLFTQWVPHTWSESSAPGRARRLRRSGHRRLQRARAELQAVGDPPAGDRAVRDGARLRTGRRQHLPRRAHARAAVPHAARTRVRGLHDADRRPLPVLVGDARRRRRDRDPRAAVHAAASCATRSAPRWTRRGRR